jgi:hypothetical protein
MFFTFLCWIFLDLDSNYSDLLCMMICKELYMDLVGSRFQFHGSRRILIQIPQIFTNGSMLCMNKYEKLFFFLTTY